MFNLSLLCLPCQALCSWSEQLNDFQNSFVSGPHRFTSTMLTFVVSADTSVRLDANNMMAGQALIFELTLVSIDPVKN